MSDPLDRELEEDYDSRETNEPDLPLIEDDEAGEAPGGVVAEETSTDDGYSERVQRRIGKEVSRRKAEETQRLAAEARIAELEARLNKLTQTLDERGARAAEESAKFEEERLKGRVESAKLKHRKAVEEVDPAGQAEALDELLEARDQLAKVRTIPVQSTSSATSTAGPSYQAPAKPLPTGTRDWMSRNSWFSDEQALRGDQRLAQRAQLAIYLDSVLQSEGYSPHDPEMYSELDRRLDVALGSSKRSPKTRAQSAVVGSSYDGGGAQLPASQRLTREDLDTMERFGFDPNKPADRKTWLRYRED